MSEYLKTLESRLTQGDARRKRGQQGIQSLMSVLQQQQQAAPVVAPQTANPKTPQAVAATAGGLYKGKDEADTLMGRLNQMIKDAPGTITLGPTSRDYATQVRLWNAYKAGKGPQAARPGTSKHGNGRANDLKYQDDATRQWALANADKYGLAFPIYNPKLARHLDESWHIEVKKGTY